MPSQKTVSAPPASRRPLLATLLLLIGSSLLSGCQAVLFHSLNATIGKSDVVVQRDVMYDPAHELALDVFRPSDARNAPVVVFFFGGSWKSGKRQWYRWAGEALAKRGMVVVIPDYRLWPTVKLDGFMQDAAHAVAWTHAHASEYGGNPDDMFVMGHSAGAHIGALLATDAHWLNAVGMQPRQLAGFIGLAGPYDFLPLKDPDFIDMFGSTHEAQLQSQPVHFVDGDEPPMLLLQGTSDKTVWPRNTESLTRALRKENETVVVKLYPDIGHLAILFSISKPLRSKAPVIDDTMRFIHAHTRALSTALPVAANSR
ncbi:alpha/beta hydrolase [Rhodanobacter sp. AS-Z3]|uniref:alpha/beta hydrolase n=1 Tax=Rhodanobacter sp. AS-Z3 TaxID=3031330 RepID=UPI002478D37D|nr:alpha/beta hydrolase [Rhodanobacter sp. AS-Z3]WEN13431.1 alpha/beta hydrolase [Rhodanobacter sp. AS-Z3]